MASMLITTSAGATDSKDAEHRYVEDLKGVYSGLTPTRTSDDQWPPPCTRRVFNLAMIKEEEVQRGRVKDTFVRMTITGKLDDIMKVKYPIELANIFKDVAPNKRNVVLMEGAPGCGKSTLSIFISQQWSEGKLFEEYKAVILVRLRDPAIQKAKSIVDLMPSSSQDSTVTEQAEKEMRASDFKDVLFILDGWDELPLILRESKESIFQKLIDEDLAKKNGLSGSSVIVTSRPVASGDVQKVVSARIEILGFTPTEMTDYFRDCLENDVAAVKELQDKIEENPVIAGSCRLPLNASILVHLYKNHRHGRLPTSQYEVFSLLICTCVTRHVKEREKRGHLMFESLQQLAETDSIKEAFRFLCSLAYEGVMDNQITFSSLPHDVNTLSILQGVESFVKRTEKSMSYNFIHLSIQELLAAFFIATWLPADQQVNEFKKLFKEARFNAVFCFYAAITKLQTPGIKEVIADVGEQCGEEDPSDQAKDLLVSLLHGLYEAQDTSLCEFVMKFLHNGLDLGHKTLNPTDCLCIGYFLSCVCKTTSDAGEFEAILLNGHMGNEGCRYLAKGLQKHLDISGHDAKTKLHLNLRWNNLHEAGSIELCGVLKTGCVSAMNMNGNDELGDEGALHIAEHLQECTAFKELSIYTCGIRSAGGCHLAKALRTNNTLVTLNIGGNGLCDEGVVELADALKHNHCLQSLNLSSCGMTDVGFKSLAESLRKNDTLRELKLYNFQNQKYLNVLSDGSGCIKYLTESLKENDTLTDLVLPKDFESCVVDMQETVNETRKGNEVKELQVKVQGHTLAHIKRRCEEEKMQSQEDQMVEESGPPSPETTVLSPMPRPELFQELTQELDDGIAEKEEEPVAMETEAEPTSYQLLSDHDLRSVEVCGKTTVEVTNNPQNFYWTGYGFKLQIKGDSLPEGVEKCTIDVYASLAGDYEFPDNSHPVSPIFWLRCEPRCRFTHPITMKIQHCAKPQNCSKLRFVKALCSQKELPYAFRLLTLTGHFDDGRSCEMDDCSYGIIELSSFSGVAVIQEGVEEDREYVAKSYYHTPKAYNYNIHVVVTWDDEAHLTVVKEAYGQKAEFSEGTELPIEFESNEIKLDIPREGTKLEKGWMLTPLTPPVFLKKKIDTYKRGKSIPTCYLSADFNLSEREDVPMLLHQVNLIGAKEPYNMFSIKPPDAIPKRGGHKLNARKKRLMYKHHKAKRRRINSAMYSEAQVPTDVSCSMQKSASFGEFDGTSGGMSDGKEKDSHARKRKKRRKKKRTQSTHVRGSAKVAPVQKSASVDHVERKLDVLAEDESESEEDKPPSKQQRTDQDSSDEAFNGNGSSGHYVTEPQGETMDDAISTEANGTKHQSKYAQPTLKNLQLIRWQDENGELKKFRLRRSICNKWQIVGDLISVDVSILESWGTKYRGDSLQCIKRVLSHWLDHPTEEYPASWEGMYRLLEDIECSNVAKKLRQCVNDASVLS